MQLDQLIPLHILYESSHNYTSVGTVWAKYFELCRSRINPIVKGKTVLEIGCPSGKLALQCQHYQDWYIVEPNQNKTVVFPKNVHFIETFFDTSFSIHMPIDVIVHSHLFEHLYDPNEFLKKCHELLTDTGEMVFGVPNMQHLTEHSLCLFAGLFFEHTLFLNKDNIRYLLETNGFAMVDIVDYENHSTIYHARKTNVYPPYAPCCIHDYYPEFTRTIAEYTAFVETCNRVIANNPGKHVYLFGASYNTQLLLCIGLNAEPVRGIVDNCKEKQGKHLYGSKLRIYGPDVLTDDSIVILINGYYVDEIRQQIMEINPNTLVMVK
jgi:SAM-dependent methyltransferase